MRFLKQVHYIFSRRYLTTQRLTAKQPEVTKLKITLDNNDVIPKSVNNIEVNKINLTSEASVKNCRKDDQAPVLPPSIRNVRIIIDKYKDNVVLTQMGSFYELYFEQATKYAPNLNITLTSKNFTSGKVPFAGFPVNQLNRHLKVLVNQYGYSVTIVDQFKKDLSYENDPNKFQRRVTRIVTPGTFIDEAFENFKENSYLLNIEFPENCVYKTANENMKLGLCWCDVSTGEIFVQQIRLKELASAITRIQPREILLRDNLMQYNIETGKWYPELVELKKYFIKYYPPPSAYRSVESFVSLFAMKSNDQNQDNNVSQLNFILQTFEQKEIASLRNILNYVSDHFPNYSINFQIPQRQLVSSLMQIDSRTSRALELHSTVLNNSKKGSLLSAIRRTVTPVGTRLLTQWLSGPSLDLKEIKNRQQIVNFFLLDQQLSMNLTNKLKKICDLSRIIQKFSFGGGSAIELIQLAKSLRYASEISDLLYSSILQYNKKRMSTRIFPLIENLKFDNTIIENVLSSLNEDEIMKNDNLTMDTDNGYSMMTETVDESVYSTNIINPSNHPDLKKLYDEYCKLQSKKDKYESEYNNFFIKKFGIRKVSLKQRQNKDYALHLTGNSQSLKNLVEQINQDGSKQVTIEDQPFQILQKSSQSLWVSHKFWTDLGYAIENSTIRIKQEERTIIDSYKNQFVANSNEIRILNGTLGYIDALLSFAMLAKEKNLVCPKVDDSTRLKIIGGRHLMVEEGLATKSLETIVSNDCHLESGNLWVITGPNMGGKSTFLRQNAIIVILAQIGCFVPCDRAHVGLVDKIFSRIGSADDLYNEMSTFMVEMIETSFILRGATNRSLAILDEIGRGTSGTEGINIAYATLKYLIENNKCRSLFATHFGNELNNILQDQASNNNQDDVDSMERLINNIKFYQSNTIKIDATRFIYDYKLRPGICSKSDALNVAKLAGFPAEALQVATNLGSDLDSI